MVEDGEVVAASAMDEQARPAVDSFEPRDLPTLNDLLVAVAEVRTAGGYEVIEVETAADGHPTEITLDDEDSVDEEACQRITGSPMRRPSCCRTWRSRFR